MRLNFWIALGVFLVGVGRPRLDAASRGPRRPIALGVRAAG